MGRRGLAVVAALFAALPAVATACGDDSAADEVTLPPIATTTTTTTIVTTTTTYVPVEYEVQRGDTLKSIAEQFGVDLTKLAILNGIPDPDDIQAGQVLLIPPPTSSTSTTSTTA